MYFVLLCITCVSKSRMEPHQARNRHSGKVLVVAESRLSELPREKPKQSTVNGPGDDSKKSNAKVKTSSGAKKENIEDSYEVLEKVTGASLVGTK